MPSDHSFDFAGCLRVYTVGEDGATAFTDHGIGSGSGNEMTDLLALDRFRTQFARFQSLIADNDKGNAFTNFQEGIAGVWEGYKPRLRDHALHILAFDGWS